MDPIIKKIGRGNGIHTEIVNIDEIATYLGLNRKETMKLFSKEFGSSIVGENGLAGFIQSNRIKQIMENYH